MYPNTTTTLQGSEKRMPVTTFLRDTFFPGALSLLTEDVYVDFKKGGQKVAPFIASNVGGLNSGRTGYNTNRYVPPRTAPQRPINPEILKLRQLGENIHSTKTPEERASDIMQKDVGEMDDEITRREELMTSELLTSGKLTIKGYTDEQKTIYVDDSLDFGFSNKVILTGEAKWNATNSAKYDDLARSCETVMKSGYNPEYAILGKGAQLQILKDEKFLKLLDITRLSLASIAPQLRIADGNGVSYLGRINALGIDLYTYLAWYWDDETRALKPYFPENMVTIAPGSIGEFKYGAVTQVEEGDKQYHTYEGSRVPKEWTDVNNDVKMCRITSKPLPVPFDIDSWETIEVY